MQQQSASNNKKKAQQQQQTLTLGFFNLPDRSHLPKGNKSAHLFYWYLMQGTLHKLIVDASPALKASPSPGELLFNFTLFIDHSERKRESDAHFLGWSNGHTLDLPSSLMFYSSHRCSYEQCSE